MVNPWPTERDVAQGFIPWGALSVSVTITGSGWSSLHTFHTFHTGWVGGRRISYHATGTRFKVLIVWPKGLNP